ncbi:MAG: protein phosphatase 2C domain-containing protein [Eubacteriales bacterium]
MKYEVMSKAGDRGINEDSQGIAQRDGEILFVLCDGLGGHGQGEVASQLAVDISKKIFVETELSYEELLESCIKESHSTLKQMQIETNSPNDLKTTMTVVYFNEADNKIQFAHVGDSRIYIFKKHKIQTQSYDHSIPQMLVYQGEIKHKDIRFHEDRNRLTRVVGGMEDEVKSTLSEKIEISKETNILMCSDGYWEWMDERFMSSTLRKSKNPEEWLERMEAQIIKKGSNRDNYTAIAIFNN